MNDQINQVEQDQAEELTFNNLPLETGQDQQMQQLQQLLERVAEFKEDEIPEIDTVFSGMEAFINERQEKIVQYINNKSEASIEDFAPIDPSDERCLKFMIEQRYYRELITAKKLPDEYKDRLSRLDLIVMFTGHLMTSYVKHDPLELTQEVDRVSYNVSQTIVEMFQVQTITAVRTLGEAYQENHLTKELVGIIKDTTSETYAKWLNVLDWLEEDKMFLESLYLSVMKVIETYHSLINEEE